MNRGIWLGFFFFVALVVLGFVTLLVQNVSFLGEPVLLRVHFERVLGLRPGDDVRVDGVLMGKVSSIGLQPDTGVLVTLKLNAPVTLYQDAEIVVGSTSVLGGNHVAIKRGSRSPARDLGDVLPGRLKPGLDEFGELASENRENIRTLIGNLKDLTQALKDGQGTVGKLLKSDELHKEAVDTVKSVRDAVGEVKGEVKKVGDNLSANITKLTDKLTDKIDNAQGPVGALLNDKKMTEQLARTLNNVEETSKNLKEITDTVRKGEGALGKIVSDKALGDRLDSTMTNVEKTSESIRKVADKLASGEGTVGRLIAEDDLYDQARKALEDLDRTLGRASRSLVEVEGDGRLHADSGMDVYRLGIRISPSEDKFFYVGASVLSLSWEGDVNFEKKALRENDMLIKADVQIGYRLPWILDRRLMLRGGLMEGKGGAAAELTWERWGLFTYPVTFGFEIRDMVRFPLWIRRGNWFENILSKFEVSAGVSRLGNDGDRFIGIGMRWADEDIRTLISLIGTAR
jgi:phospholipid/cholesterol/gamma-HCH transport system substrate-binding protein